MKEIVVVTRSRTGLLADITEALGRRGINIETIDAEELHGTAIVELTVDLYDEALQALRDAGFDAVSEDALLIRLRDEPGALAKIAKRFKEANIALRSVRFIRRQDGWALVAVATDRTEDAKRLAKECVVNE
jgi:hypothetical protein